MALIVLHKTFMNGQIASYKILDTDTVKETDIDTSKFNELIEKGVVINDMWKDIDANDTWYRRITKLVGVIGDKAIVYDHFSNKTYMLDKDISFELIDSGDIGVPSIAAKEYVEENFGEEVTVTSDAKIKYIIDSSYVDRFGYAHVIGEIKRDEDEYTVADRYGKYIGEVRVDGASTIIVKGNVKSIKIACIDGESDRVDIWHSGLRDGRFKEFEYGKNNDSTRYENIEKVYIEEGVEIISTGCFYVCPFLKEVALPRSIKFIGANAFRECDYLEEISIYDGVKYIGAEAFAYTGIREMTIPSTVEFLGADAFQGCYQLKEIIFQGVDTDIQEQLFRDCYELDTIYVPDGFDVERLKSICDESSVDPEIIVC